MKNYLKEFCKRGLMASVGGPIIVVIVYLCIYAAGNLETLTIPEVALAVFTSSIMTFLIAGVSILYQIEKLPKAFAGLIHGAMLYLIYISVYLINGWLKVEYIWVFSLIFIVGFIVIWLAIYIPTRIKINKINKNINK